MDNKRAIEVLQKMAAGKSGPAAGYTAIDREDALDAAIAALEDDDQTHRLALARLIGSVEIAVHFIGDVSTRDIVQRAVERARAELEP